LLHFIPGLKQRLIADILQWNNGIDNGSQWRMFRRGEAGVDQQIFRQRSCLSTAFSGGNDPTGTAWKIGVWEIVECSSKLQFPIHQLSAPGTSTCQITQAPVNCTGECLRYGFPRQKIPLHR
jgi:hypothetical protein